MKDKTRFATKSRPTFSHIRRVYDNHTLQHPDKPSHTGLLMGASVTIMWRDGVVVDDIRAHHFSGGLAPARAEEKPNVVSGLIDHCIKVSQGCPPYEVEPMNGWFLYCQQQHPQSGQNATTNPFPKPHQIVSMTTHQLAGSHDGAQ
jgi:hypothetical protein